MSEASNIPPSGFHKQIDVHFFNQEDGVTRLPYVSTCSLEMWLPRGKAPEALAEMLIRCMKESEAF